MKNRNGFNMVELVIVMVILSILALVGAGTYNKSISNARREVTANTMQIFATNMEEVYGDLGVFEISQSSEKERDTIDYLYEITDTYLNFTFDMDTLTMTGEGFTVMTKTLQDGWGQNMKFYMTIGKINPRAMLISSGDNLIFDDSNYTAGEFKDDMVMLMKPKED